MTQIQKIRAFNRFYTNFLGLLDNHYLPNFSLSECRIFYELNQPNPIAAAQLVTSLKIDKGYLSRILKKFEKQEWVIKSPSKKDKRSQNLTLSQKGRAVLKTLTLASEQQIQTHTQHLSAIDKTELLYHLQKVQAILGGEPKEKATVTLKDITIRTELKVGDLPFVIQSHSDLYQKEYNYGKTFDYYVIKGVAEFFEVYNPEKSRVWVCEHKGKRIGFLSLMEREAAAQLRFFFMNKNYRGIGLGRKLMELFIAFLKEKGYKSCYLWTTTEQLAAAGLYKKFGFKWVEDMPSTTTFDRPVIEQKYELLL